MQQKVATRKTGCIFNVHQEEFWRGPANIEAF